MGKGKKKQKESAVDAEEEAAIDEQLRQLSLENAAGPSTRSPKAAENSSGKSANLIEKIDSLRYRINIGFVPNMNVPGMFFVNDTLSKLVFEELEASSKGGGGFLPAVRQIANVASLPGIVGCSVGLPDMHSGYGFAIGNVAAFDMDDPTAIVSPGGVGFDINCGVRLIRTNLKEEDVKPLKEKLCQALYDNVPVGVGSTGSLSLNRKELDAVLTNGLKWAVEQKFAWPEDLENCEENGCLETADAGLVSDKAKKRGLQQVGTLGAGNHYAEVQVVDEIFDPESAAAMGIREKGQVCVMIHSGSRGLGHQVATDALMSMEAVMARQGIKLNDRQLACARVNSKEGQNYLSAMGAAANFAWVNRAYMTHLTRQTFEQVFGRSARDLDMHLVYDVCHNIAKVEDHVVNGEKKRVIVHRKGATRSFPPHHPLVPKAYKDTGQPVLIGGSMGTCSYVLCGTEKAMSETFGSTCHGAGRAHSRHNARAEVSYHTVLKQLEDMGISIRAQTKSLIGEEAPYAYKDVTEVVNTCHEAGISRKIVKLRPIAVIKG
mmetsp:Transcript_26303/g.43089  ORF Transcript_26303/g.43089 Transcript_26303/m.43089 type:complete len:547 (+) Transcript_26303:198-1838(+)